MDRTVEVVATAMAAGGDALARDDDGRVVFVGGALPGERVRARVVQAKKDFLRAVVVDVVEPSPDRIDGSCVPGCSGCTWQHVAPEAQGRLKVAIVADGLRRIGRFADGEVPVGLRRPLDGAARSLRTTVRMGLTEDGRPGERRRGSREVVPADEPCRATHPLLHEVIAGGRFRGADEVVLRVGVASSERAALGLGSPSSSSGPFEAHVPADVAVGPGAVVHEAVAEAWLQVSIESFFQSGPGAAEALVAAVDEAAGDAAAGGGHLVDAYAGVGLFGATVGARRGARVTSIESEPAAAADSRVNLAELTDARVYEGEVGRWRPAGGDPSVDVVVADPSRAGLGRPGVATVEASGCARLVLVSCDPASLARDARLLVDAGFRLAEVELVDAFPDTFHVEAVSRFDRT